MNISNNRIAIFDDEEDILSICTYILEEQGWQVTGFKDCSNILEKVSALMPAVILMDNKISPIGGVEASQLIKRADLLGHLPIILFSAHTDIEQLAHEAGAAAYLAKPFDLEELQQAILSVTGNN